ncbi:hypothetical protein [Flagellimonas allohymeniacidonis]|uniref:Uncharacterized protein n=1 Tax=Flagellimonas allohymeniacidonis TaxID=2517819 RepID=A0A4Q8QFK9_9FLAO|nr:hypothetical protein [Allomuricauda hymeniacidonis]TAI48487.1 hypothetical protein EW142_01395 [Allomuricauda hymeniacidonis]
MEIKYDVLGKIIEGKKTGWYVRFIDDSENTGGFYIYKFEDPDSDEGFDTWLETENDVKGYIYESEWKIEWMQEAESP